jgi:hypothetical protein
VRPAEGRVEARGKFVRKKEKAKAGEAVVKDDAAPVEGLSEENGDVEMTG